MITEINRSKFSVGQIHFQHPEKKPLTPLVVIRITGNDLIFPGEHVPHRTKLKTHPLNVFVGPVFGMDVVFDCSVFCWKTECIETNRKKHLIPLHLQKSGIGVRRSHGIPVSNVQIPGWIGKHRQHVIT